MHKVKASSSRQSKGGERQNLESGQVGSVHRRQVRRFVPGQEQEQEQDGQPPQEAVQVIVNSIQAS